MEKLSENPCAMITAGQKIGVLNSTAISAASVESAAKNLTSGANSCILADTADKPEDFCFTDDRKNQIVGDCEIIIDVLACPRADPFSCILYSLMKTYQGTEDHLSKCSQRRLETRRKSDHGLGGSVYEYSAAGTVIARIKNAGQSCTIY